MKKYIELYTAIQYENNNIKNQFIKDRINVFSNQDFKNAEIIIDNGAYYIPAKVINGSENFGKYGSKEYNCKHECRVKKIFISHII